MDSGYCVSIRSNYGRLEIASPKYGTSYPYSEAVKIFQNQLKVKKIHLNKSIEEMKNFLIENEYDSKVLKRIKETKFTSETIAAYLFEGSPQFGLNSSEEVMCILPNPKNADVFKCPYDDNDE